MGFMSKYMTAIELKVLDVKRMLNPLITTLSGRLLPFLTRQFLVL